LKVRVGADRVERRLFLESGGAVETVVGRVAERGDRPTRIGADASEVGRRSIPWVAFRSGMRSCVLNRQIVAIRLFSQQGLEDRFGPMPRQERAVETASVEAMSFIVSIAEAPKNEGSPNRGRAWNSHPHRESATLES
jgi:hypothetical protein